MKVMSRLFKFKTKDMIRKKLWFHVMVISLCSAVSISAQQKKVVAQTIDAMKEATRYMVEEVSTNGGYVGTYLPDLSRRWGELELYNTQIQVQSDGVVAMGNVFLDAYDATGDEYYYEAAEKAANALIWGQLPCGGWNYIIDFAGDSSLKNWYATIGKNAWGFEEFNHYYGNATFDDSTTSDAASFLLRIYIQKLDRSFKPALDKAINFVLESQYPLGGWPQRYPLKYDFPHGELEDYTSFYTFNDFVIWGNINFLLQCYVVLGEERLLDAIHRGMNFYLLSQLGNPQGGWGEQYNLNLEPAHARTYEPPALLPYTTYKNIILLTKFYRLTGDRKYLTRIPDAIDWLERSRLAPDGTNNGRYTHPAFIEVGTNKPLYSHRKGNGVTDGHYWWDYEDTNPLLHYGAKSKLDLEPLKAEFRKVASLSPEEASKDSPLKARSFTKGASPQEYYRKLWPITELTLPLEGNSLKKQNPTDEAMVKDIINSLDERNRWMVQHIQITRPYSISDEGVETNTARLSEESGKGIVDASDQKYLSTREYVKNMGVLIAYLNSTGD